jgi:hypothetical protein
MNWMALNKGFIIFIILLYPNPHFIVSKLEAKDDQEEHTQTHVCHVQKEITVIIVANAIIQPSYIILVKAHKFKYLKKVWIIIYRLPHKNGLKARDISLLLNSLHQMELAINGTYQPIIYFSITAMGRNLSTSKMQKAVLGNVSSNRGLDTNSQKKSTEFSGI